MSSPTPDRADSPARRGAIFAACVLVALLAGYGLGKLAVSPAPSADAGHQHGAPVADTHDHGSPGYSLAVQSTPDSLRFTVHGPDGAPVTRFETVHDKQMHLIVVRTDLTGYQHLHPALGPDGVWSVPLRLGSPGVWQVFADFATVDKDGHRFEGVLTAFLNVAGGYAPVPMPAPAAAAVVDGLTVTLDGAARAGAASAVTLRVARGGVAVAALDRYLGAFGHLVVLRESDLSYLHVHPDEQMVDGGMRFWMSAPAPGRYRAYFDFSVDGIVRTAEFTVVAT